MLGVRNTRQFLKSEANSASMKVVDRSMQILLGVGLHLSEVCANRTAHSTNESCSENMTIYQIYGSKKKKKLDL